MSVTKSVTIQFVTVSLDELIIELDSVMNDEETQFKYGEKAYFRAFSYPIDLSLTLTPTDGVISNEGNGDSDEEDEIITFINTNEGSTSKPVQSITSYSWLGNSLGSVSAMGSTITASKEGTGVLKITYKSNFRRFGLVLLTRDEDTYTVIIVVVGE